MCITFELLKKYAEGNCTQQEKYLVEKWLANTQEEQDTLPEEQLDYAVSKMWDDIAAFQSQSQGLVMPLYKKMIHHLVAACIGIVLIAVTTWIIFGERGGNEVAQKNVKGVKAKNIQLVGYKSEAQYITQLCRNSKTICYDQLISIRDNSGNAFDLSLLTKPQSITCTSREIITPSGRNYYAVQFQYGSDQVVVFTKEEIDMFTPELLRRAVKITQI